MAEGLASQPASPRLARERPGRTPEEIRAMLSSYSSGLERGRRMVGGGGGASHGASHDGNLANGSHNGNGIGGGAERVWPQDDPNGTEEP